MAQQLVTEPLVITNPVDTQIFRPSGFKDFDSIAFVGRILESKGIFLLLKAFRLLIDQHNKDLQLHIVGSGPDIDAVKKKVIELRLANNVRLHGSLPPIEVAKVLQLASVLVVPSLVEELFGLTALEGLACACKVVATRRGGLPEALGGLGYLCDPTEESLASTIKQALLDARTLMSQESLAQYNEHIQEHSPQVIAEKYITAIRTILNT